MRDNEKYYLEYLTKNPDAYKPLDSILVARMKRIANNDCRSVFESNSNVLQYKDSAVVEMASPDDAGIINEIL